MKKTKAVIPRKRRPSSVTDVLERTLHAYRLDRKVAQYCAFPHWTEIVGEEIAKVAAPVKITRGGTMVVRVLDAVWSQELSMRKPELLEKLSKFGSGAPIDDIKFVTGNPKTINEN